MIIIMKVFNTIMIIILPFIVFSQNNNFSDAQSSAEVKGLIFNVEKFPDSVSLHHLLLQKFKAKDSLAVEKQYEYWLKKFPKSAVIPFIIGRYYYGFESPKAKKYLLHATEMNSKNAEAWHFLSMDALRWGDYDGQLSYLIKAMTAAPNDPQYPLHYISVLKSISKLKLDSVALDVFLRFKGIPEGAKALVFLARKAESAALKRSYYELLLKNYSTMQPPAFRDGISEYFSMLIDARLYNKAFDLALNMVSIIEINKLEWKYKLKVANQFVIYKDFLEQNKPEKALEVLNEIKLHDDLSASRVFVDETVLLLKAEMMGSIGALQASYKRILNYYSNEPSYKIRDVLLDYGAKLKKDTNEVKRDVYNIRDSLSKEADAFSLVNYLTGKKVFLSDYKGKIVLLTFWFPGCGPCRAEFPYFEAALKKFNKDQIIYLAVNINRSQDEYVVPFLNNTKYSFIPLQDDISWNKGNFSISGAPANFLIDQRGKIMWSKFFINEYSKTDLELMIKLLL
jgi:thiol-disulfide isomerase/thioredoxin